MKLVVLLLLSSCLATPRDPRHLTYKIDPGFSEVQQDQIRASLADWERATSGRFSAVAMPDHGDPLALPNLEFEPAEEDASGNAYTINHTYGSYNRIPLRVVPSGVDGAGVTAAEAAEHSIGLVMGLTNEPSTDPTIMAWPQRPDITGVTSRDAERFAAIWGP